jgi:ribosome recycling factor
MKQGQPSGQSQPFKSVKEVESNAKSRMEKAVADLTQHVSTIRTGRASIGLLEPVRVEYYGAPTPLTQMATLHVPEPGMITVQPWDVSQIGAIEKAIRSADLGLNPMNDGKIVRVPIPPLTQDRRKELVKHLHNITEDHRVALRNVRRDANEAVKKLLKDKLISEDEDRRAHDEIQKLTDAEIKKIDAVSAAKEKEILELK